MKNITLDNVNPTFISAVVLRGLQTVAVPVSFALVPVVLGMMGHMMSSVILGFLFVAAFGKRLASHSMGILYGAVYALVVFFLMLSGAWCSATWSSANRRKSVQESCTTSPHCSGDVLVYWVSMSKTFTCRELGGVCDQPFSGETFDEIIQRAMPHLHQDEAHMANLKTLSETSGESKDEWIARMQKEFGKRAED